MGLKGLELHKKMSGSSKWERVNLPMNLPPADLSSRPASSHSPPPDRPGHGTTRDKRGRGSSGSDSEQTSSKVAKQSDKAVEADVEEVWSESVKNATLVSNGSPSKSKPTHDPGNFTNIQGTPVKVSLSPEVVQSPILSRAGKKPL